jgi:hypothetical protein
VLDDQARRVHQGTLGRAPPNVLEHSVGVGLRGERRQVLVVARSFLDCCSAWAAIKVQARARGG